MKKHLLLILSVAITLAVTSCDLLPWGNTGATVDDIEAELDFTANPPVVSGTASLINITGNIGSEDISMSWDFQAVAGADPYTNGLMSTQISSTVPGTVSLYFDNDFSSSGGANEQDPSEWYLRFTLGNASPDYTIYNSMETFTIPEAPYSLITLRQGPDSEGNPEYRNRYYDSDNLMTGKVTSMEYDSAANTLRLIGSLKSTWDAGWVQADFNVLIAGPDDRQASTNASSMEYAYE